MVLLPNGSKAAELLLLVALVVLVLVLVENGSKSLALEDEGLEILSPNGSKELVSTFCCTGGLPDDDDDDDVLLLLLFELTLLRGAATAVLKGSKLFDDDDDDEKGSNESELLGKDLVAVTSGDWNEGRC